jgi:hypothetical protein
MLIEKIIREPMQAFIYMERYVNKGSPSGFSSRNTTSPATSSRTGTATYELPYFEISKDSTHVFGKTSVADSVFRTKDDRMRFFVHPDMVKVFANSYKSKEIDWNKVAGTITVVPTANDRTVISLDDRIQYFLKLHYDSTLGRINRALPLKNAIAGPENSLELERLLSEKQLPPEFAFFPEPCTLVVLPHAGPKEGAGVVLRPLKPLPLEASGPLIPFFSLFSQDDINPEDPLILTQILSSYDKPIDTLMNRIIFPILNCYSSLTFKQGLLQENNAQNLLLCLEEGTYHPKYIVHRDLMGIRKDLPIKRELGLPTHFVSEPYKCNDFDMGEDYYRSHSDCYDFKLGNYILKELVTVAVQQFKADERELVKVIADAFWHYSGGRCWDHFNPRDKWYDFGDQLLTGKRKYIEHDNPMFRHW